MADPIAFELVSPERLLLAEPVEMVVVPGGEGDFGVLARHAPMITTVRPGVIAIYAGAKIARRIFVAGGFAEVTPERCTVLAEEAFALEGIDRRGRGASRGRQGTARRGRHGGEEGRRPRSRAHRRGPHRRRRPDGHALARTRRFATPPPSPCWARSPCSRRASRSRGWMRDRARCSADRVPRRAP